ncbi:MAG TPA: endonuclease domain-containing protein [Aestuariivirga sp.]|nr:endonuclease domain-containing protein [Aestuariivirga sp.]
MVDRLARHLRNNATDAERKLWQELRLLKNGGKHFRRQVPIAGRIADFACHRCKLVVELDGGQHNESANVRADRARTDEIRRHGYRGIRFWNADIFGNLEGVVDMIRHAAGLATMYSYEDGLGGATPTPNLSPQGGGE